MAEFARPITLSVAPNTPQTVLSLMVAAGYTGAAALAEIDIRETGAGNLVITTNAAATTEADGVPVGDTDDNGFHARSGGGISDSINAAALYLLSSTASKTITIYARSKV